MTHENETKTTRTTITNDEARYQEAMRKMDREQFVRQMKEAATLLSQGDGAAAAPILERLAEIYPDDVDVAINLGGAYILSKQWKSAIEVLEIASQHDTGNPAIWANLAAAYLGTLPISTRKKQDQAIAAYKRTIELNPHYPNAHYNLGLIYEDRAEWKNAETMFAQAIKVNPLDQDARALHAKAQRILNMQANPHDESSGLQTGFPTNGSPSLN